MQFDRRDFLRFSALVSISTLLSKVDSIKVPKLSKHKKKNIIVLLVDAVSARHLSLYGYNRETTPNLVNLANRGIVYHSHFSAGSFTTSGVASMFTGMYPWSHRAINVGGFIKPELKTQNIFNLLGKEYYHIVYSQNYYSNILLNQFQDAIDLHIPITSFIYKPRQILVSQHLLRDQNVGFHSLENAVFNGNHIPGSVFLGYLDRLYHQSQVYDNSISSEYPYGLPSNGYYHFINQSVYKGVLDLLINVQSRVAPFFAFVHLYSPHAPYTPRKQYIDTLDEIKTVYKSKHKLSANKFKKMELYPIRTKYDEYLADVDSEIGVLINSLESSGVLNDTVLILTSDHGELFERGEFGHLTRLMFDPVIRIPLMIIVPGQKFRKDVYTPTGNVDILPTVLHIAGKKLPNHINGKILPGFGGEEDAQRSVFSMDAKENSAFTSLDKGTITLIKGTDKLIYYHGYDRYKDVFEHYNLQEDIEEKKNLFDKNSQFSLLLRDEMLTNLEAANKPYINPTKEE